MLGCIAADKYEYIAKAETFAENLGLAFQIIDDILDFLEGEDNSDIISGKSTYVSLLGLEEAKKLADDYTQKAMQILDEIPESSEVREFAVTLLNRKA